MNSAGSNSQSLECHWFTPSGFKDIGNKQVDVVSRNQFP